MALSWAFVFGAIGISLVGIPGIVLMIHLNRIKNRQVRAAE